MPSQKDIILGNLRNLDVLSDSKFFSISYMRKIICNESVKHLINQH